MPHSARRPDRDAATQSVQSSATSNAHEDAMLLKNLQESFTASLESSKAKQQLRRAKPLSARRAGEYSSTQRCAGGTCSAPASATGSAYVSGAPAAVASQDALEAAVEKLKSEQHRRSSIDVTRSGRKVPDRSETQLLVELQRMFAQEIRRKNKERRCV